MQYAYAVFELLAGLGAFLIGVKLLSENMEKLATDKLRNLFNRNAETNATDKGAHRTGKQKFKDFLKTAKTRLVGVGIGTATTAVVQSSSLTTVMVVGLVNVGVMTLTQATTIIMGANIGTTITAQIAALQSFDVAKFAVALTGIGVLVAMFSKKEKVQTVSYAIAGLGLVFVGLDVMSSSMAFFRESDAIKTLFSSITNPFLLFFLGIAVTAIVQSSSAVTAILISMVGEGLMIGGGGNDVLFIILGTNIGTCVTALLSSMGATINAKRAAVIHLLFNCIGSIIFFIILICWQDMAAMTLEKWFPGHPDTQIAMFHTFFNVICTVLFLPFTRGFVKLSEILVQPRKRRHGKEESEAQPVSTRLDKRLLATPSIAVDNATQEALEALKDATLCLRVAIDGFVEKDLTKTDEVTALNAKTDERLQNIDKYLVQVSAYDVTIDLERRIAALHSCLGDIHRVGELAQNVTKYTRRTDKDNLYFSPKVKDDVKDMFSLLENMSSKAGEAMTTGAGDLLDEVDRLENEIDARRKRLIKEHVQRLGSGECRPESSNVFVNLVCNLERVGDHLNYIAHSSDSN